MKAEDETKKTFRITSGRSFIACKMKGEKEKI